MSLVVNLVASFNSVGEGSGLEINSLIMPRDRPTTKSGYAHKRRLAL
ncbi:MAG TPA: hypothetical protein PK620_09540 [Denitromonas sp.]|nr:hypothetical protein [Rhodocyclaceae bacterium]MCP5223096.1 hypothetical protein [Zoogloeaceae bacterium]HQU88491.1 hypothetical protein [Denitromonas sp.]HQV15147.1 hypothetical protein [Denitromonas sp.]